MSILGSKVIGLAHSIHWGEKTKFPRGAFRGDLSVEPRKDGKPVYWLDGKESGDEVDVCLFSARVASFPLTWPHRSCSLPTRGNQSLRVVSVCSDEISISACPSLLFGPIS